MNIRALLIKPVFALCLCLLLLAPRLAPQPAGAVPANDNLANAITVITPAGAPGIVAVGSSVGATLEGSENVTCNIGTTIWYTWTSPVGSGTAVFDTWGSSFDTVIAAYTGNSFPLTNLTCNDDFFSYPGPGSSAISFAYTPSTAYYLQVGGFGGASTGTVVLNMSLGAAIYVTDTAPFDTPDANINPVEATRLASGTLGRALQAGEAARVLNAAAAGVGGADLIHFSPVVFPASAPTVYTAGIIPATIITLSATNDTLSGVGAGVIIDGLNSPVFDPCLSLSGSGHRVEGLQVRNCVTGIAATANGTVIGGGLIASQRNTIYSNPTTGLSLSGSGNVIVGNYIGTNAAGSGALANGRGILITGSSNVIGGGSPGQGNLVSGNTNRGIEINGGTGNLVKGNMIGVDAGGTARIANQIGVAIFSSFNTIGGTLAGEGNVISGNDHGVNISVGSGNAIFGNKIGTNAAGTAAIPNTPYGVIIAAGQNNLTGGTGAGQANVIAYNPVGVQVQNVGVTRNSVRANAIYANTTTGIDNISSGNLELPPPSITSVAGTNINGRGCASCTVDVYTDFGSQGERYIGTTTADATGLFTLAGASHPFPNITAINVDASGNTSEFSAAFAAPIDSDGDGIANSSDACPTQPEDYDGFQDGDGCPDPDNDGDGICDPGLTALSCHGSDQGYLCFDPASPATLSCPLTDCRNMAEDYDAFHDGDGCPEPDNDNDGHPDVSDACPGTDAQAGTDGMLGSPQDANHNGFRDGAEPLFTTDDIVVTNEDWDGVLDGDGCHDSPGDDFDGDSFGAMRSGFPLFDDDREVFMGTDAGHYCAATPTANDEPAPDAWPFDFNDDQKATINDILLFIPVFNTTGPNPPYSARFDYTQDNKITINDILLFIPVFNQSCLR
jgi:hypothetical protein